MMTRLRLYNDTPWWHDKVKYSSYALINRTTRLGAMMIILLMLSLLSIYFVIIIWLGEGKSNAYKPNTLSKCQIRYIIKYKLYFIVSQNIENLSKLFQNWLIYFTIELFTYYLLIDYFNNYIWRNNVVNLNVIMCLKFIYIIKIYYLEI